MVEKVNAGDGRLPAAVRQSAPAGDFSARSPHPRRHRTHRHCRDLPCLSAPAPMAGQQAQAAPLPSRPCLSRTSSPTPHSHPSFLPSPSMPRFPLLQCTKLQSAQDGRTEDVQSCGSWGSHLLLFTAFREGSTMVFPGFWKKILRVRGAE